MPWVILILSAVLEAVWATALGQSDGLSKVVPTVVFGVAAIGSIAGLSMAMRSVPISVAYSVWIGLGAGLTVTYAMVTGAEPVSAIKVVLLVGLVSSVVGLKFVRSVPGPRAESTTEPS